MEGVSLLSLSTYLSLSVAPEAEKARNASRQLFGEKSVVSSKSESIPTYALEPEELENGIPAYQLFERGGLCKTRAEARRLISQGGGYANDKRIETFDQVFGLSDMIDDSILLRAGKKRHLKITVG